MAASRAGSGPALIQEAKATAPLREALVSNDAAAVARRRAAQTYQPDPVRLLLVAEAPPSALDRYFYFEGVSEHDSLFRYVIRGLFGEAPDRSSKPAWLERLREAGVFLIDVAEEPSGAAALGNHVGGLVARCRALSPEHIVLIKATVYDAAFEALREAGLPVVDRRIPFPGSGQQARFMVAFQEALAGAGFRAGRAPT